MITYIVLYLNRIFCIIASGSKHAYIEYSLYCGKDAVTSPITAYSLLLQPGETLLNFEGLKIPSSFLVYSLHVARY